MNAPAMPEDSISEPRRRLSDIKTLRHLLPFYRATTIEDISLYWLPVSEFPIKFRQREWILKFLDRFTAEMAKKKQVAENFLLMKHTRTDLNDRFVNTITEYRPMTGILLAPQQQLPAVPTSLEVKELTESHGPDGVLNLDHLVPDYCCWFAGGEESAHRRDFFGVGGMLTLWIDEGQEPQPFQFEIPKVIATHPAMKGVDFHEQMRKGMRLQHPFLKRSREIFAAHLPDGPVKRDSLFILPRLSSHHFTDATPDTRKSWFEIFSAYCIESDEHRGILLALKEPDFDEELIAILEAMKENGEEYPL
jgi:hypothetical protein